MDTVPQEVWKPVPGYEQRYEASSEGRLRSTGGIKHRVSGKILTANVDKKTGYHFANIMIDGKIHHRGVHQLVAAAFIGPRPDGMEVNHIDLDKTNNRPENLEYLTHGDNLRKARALKDWSAKGEQAGNAKLTEDQVRAIRRDPRSQRVVGAEYGVSGVAVCMIRQRKTWRHVLD